MFTKHMGTKRVSEDMKSIYSARLIDSKGAFVAE